MKKSLILVIILFVLSIGGAVFIGFDVNSKSDDVIFDKISEIGNPEVLENLKINLNSAYFKKMFWNTEIVPAKDDNGKALISNTKFKYSENEQRNIYKTEYNGIQLYDGIEYLLHDLDNCNNGLQKAYKEIYDELEVGEIVNKKIKLKDYIDYYPMDIHFKFKNDMSHMNYTNYEQNYEKYQNAEKGTYEYIYNKLYSFFRFPVNENDYFISDFERFKDTVSSTGELIADKFEILSFGCIDFENTSYFTFNTEYPHDIKENGKKKRIDTSLIPGGYGIYTLKSNLNSESSDISTQIDADSIKMAYSLDTDIKILELKLSKDEKELMLYTNEDGKLYLTIIDKNSMKLLQKLELVKFEYEDDFIFVRDDLNEILIHMMRDNRIVLISKNDYGKYEFEFSLKLEDEQTINFRESCSYAYDGEKLAIVEFKNYRKYGISNDKIGGLKLIVCDKDGVQYFANYSNTLSLGSFNDNYDIYINDSMNIKPISINWN